MSAHLRPLTIRCDEPGCPRTAKAELRNTVNAVLGRFCPTHAQRRLRALLAHERRTTGHARV